MKFDLLAMRTAKKHVDNYVHEHNSVMQRHYEAMDCRDCEDFLKLGIDAFNWVINADCRLRIAVGEGAVDDADELEEMLEELCKGWLAPCDFAEAWIARLDSKKYVPDNLDEFRKCCERMKGIVKSFVFNDVEELPPGLAILQAKALEQIANGQTTSFFPEEE